MSGAIQRGVLGMVEKWRYWIRGGVEPPLTSPRRATSAVSLRIGVQEGRASSGRADSQMARGGVEEEDAAVDFPGGGGEELVRRRLQRSPRADPTRQDGGAGEEEGGKVNER